MKKTEIIIRIKEYEFAHELSPDDNDVINKAKEAASEAYSPYSRLSVGAAVLLSNNKIIKGSNQENAAYPSGMCAERIALFYANSRYPDSYVKTMVICAKNKDGYLSNPIPPCGSCRQVMHETTERFNKEFKIILFGTNSIQVIDNSKHLLPLSFQRSDLPK